jgi:3-oxoacyl-[acyl-carrier-protein] synthase III
MGCYINRVAIHLPSSILTNDELSALFPEWSSNNIFEKIGVRERHYVSENETAVDLALAASEKVLKDFDKNLIDFTILCTQSPDYFLPTSACIIQDKLNLRTNTGAFDFNLGCSGFIYGLAIAKGLIKSDVAKNILLIMSETYTKHIHSEDKSNRSIFGDGAAAIIISASEKEKILEFELGTDGQGMNNLIIPNGGMRNKFNPSELDIRDDANNVRNNNYIYMNGPEIFNFTLDRIPPLVTSTLQKNGLTVDTVDYVIFHQANKYMLDYLKKKMKIPPEKFYQEMEHTGNTVSATIPIALKDSLDRGFIKKGAKVLLSGFGVGYSWGAVVIEI